MAAPGQGVVGPAGAGGAPDGNWRAPHFRAKVVAQINDALKDACNPIEKSGNELENHIFNRAKDRDSYLSLVARLILHMRDSNAAKEKGRMTPNMAGQQQDPMAALQGLTQMGQAQSSGMQMQPNPNQMVSGVVPQGNRPINRSQMPQGQGATIMDQRQQQMAQKLQKMMSGGGGGQTGPAMPITSMAQGVPQGVPQSVPQSQSSQMPHYQGSPAPGMQQGNFPGPGGPGGMTPQPQQGMPGQPGGPQGAQPQQQQQQPMHMGPGGPQGQMGMQQQQPNMMPQQMQQMTRPQQQQPFGNQMVMQAQNPQAQMQTRPQVARTFSGQPTPPVQMTDSPAYRQQPSPAQPTRGPTPGANPLQSPVSYFQPSPSPQGHSIPSPASAGSQRGEGPPSVPSPSSTLNTPGNPGSVGSVNPSPGGPVRGGPGSNQAQTDAMAYQDKLRQLSKYIDPLKRAIQNHATKEDTSLNTIDQTEAIQMKNLLGILTNAMPNKRWTLQHLIKCEQMLENYEQQMKLSVPGSHGTSSAPSTSTTTTTTDAKVATKVTSGNMFQPLLDAVRAHINSPTVNHSLQRTFGPALATLQGSPPQFQSPPKKLKTDHEPSPTTQPPVPNIVQGEVARLSPKFRVNLDPMFHCSGKEVHLVCRLDDKHLPSVPPINIAIPEQYPDLSPSYDVSIQDYGQTPFLKLVQIALNNQIMRMPDRYTLTQVLDAWEMSIRKSCLKMISARDGT